MSAATLPPTDQLSDLAEQYEEAEEQEQPADAKKEAKKPKKPVFKYDKEALINSKLGLKQLYKKGVKGEGVKLKCQEGSEARDLEAYMKVMRNWHYETCPKFEFKFFIDKLQKLGKDR